MRSPTMPLPLTYTSVFAFLKFQQVLSKFLPQLKMRVYLGIAVYFRGHV